MNHGLKMQININGLEFTKLLGKAIVRMGCAPLTTPGCGVIMPLSGVA